MHPPPEDPAAQTEALARITLSRIEAAMDSGEAPCLPELVQIIHSLSTKATSVSVEDLADRIERHVAVMARVIAAANTFGFNPGHAEITTLRQAIQVIGFDRIRSLVTSLLLVRHAVDHATAHEQRGAALGAVISGLMCQTIAADRAIVDPELAFVTAALRQLGRLLLATYFPEDYRRAAAEQGNTGFIAVFGLTPLTLTREILAKAHFPRKLLDCMYEHSDGHRVHPIGESATLMSLSEFSEQLSTMVLSSPVDKEQFEDRVNELGSHHGTFLAFSPEQLGSLMGFVGDRLEQFTGKLGFQGVSHDAVAALRSRSNRPGAKPRTKPPTPPIAVPRLPSKRQEGGQPAQPGMAQAPDSKKPRLERPDTAAPADRAPRGESDTNCDADAPSPPEPPPGTPADIQTRHWRDGLVSLTTSLGENTIHLVSLYSLALDFVRRGFGGQEALFLTIEPDGKHFTACCGVGRVFERITGQRCMHREERTVLGVCVARKENVLIHNTADPRTDAYLPAWGRKADGWGAFVSIPLHDQNHCFALMLVAWPKPTQIALSPEDARLLRSITATIAAARRLAAG
jgi:hypothetical protein